MERMRVVHISLHVAVCTLATLLLCVCLAGCESTGMGEFGSSRDTSALWNQQVPEGGGAILIMGDDSSRFWKTYQFDAGGTLVASESFNSDGGTWSVSYYHYDQGRLSSVTGSCEGGGPNTERSFETTYSYHDDGSLNVSRREDGTLTMTKSYDAAGRIVESNAVTSNDRETFEYDDQGRQRRIGTTDPMATRSTGPAPKHTSMVPMTRATSSVCTIMIGTHSSRTVAARTGSIPKGAWSDRFARHCGTTGPGPSMVRPSRPVRMMRRSSTIPTRTRYPRGQRRGTQVTRHQRNRLRPSMMSRGFRSLRQDGLW